MGGNLLFIISQPRAGSTLLQKMFGSHPLIHTESEPWIALHPLFALRKRGLATDYSASLAREALTEFLGGFPEGDEAYFEAVRRMLLYLYDRKLALSGKQIFLDKTPRYYFIASDLQRLFPEARFVFLLRNPIAVFVSVLQTFGGTDSPESLWPHRPDFVRAPWLIRDAMRQAAGRVSVVRYERLTAEPETEMRRVCADIDLPYDPSMIEYGKSEAGRAAFHFGDPEFVYQQTRPVAARASRWREALRANPIWAAWAACYLRELGPELVAEMGYSFDELAQELPEQPEYLQEWLDATR